MSDENHRVPLPVEFLEKSQHLRPVRESRALVGSSAGMTEGLPASARAMETRCC